MTRARIAPLDPPYDEKTRELFDLVMPEGMEPLQLFRTLAVQRRIFPRFMRAGVLDRGPVAIRDRELVIHRTTGRCRSEYEWGVHVVAFARPLGFSEDWIRATVEASPDDPIWTPRESLLLRMCDELHDTASIRDELWQALCLHWSDEQRIELIYTVGMYHAVSFLTNGLRIGLEPFAARFPSGARDEAERARQT